LRYLPKSDLERRQMLETLGLARMEELYAHLPPDVLLNRPLDLPAGKSEYEILDYFRARGRENAVGFASFLGAGVYCHYRPVLVDAVVSRGEFLTSYTPYQAEISQGTLTAIFEFQTMMCQLTGMDVANASMYDGSSAVAEAALMAMRITGRNRVLIARTVHPEYRETLRTYGRFGGMEIEEAGYDSETGQADLADLERGCIKNALGGDTAAVILQSPNFFGIIENVKPAAELAHRAGALLVVAFTEAVSLGLLAPPREADIVAGELQSFAIAPSYGGPFAGILACKEKFLRQIPGRLAGETRDSNGNRAFCLTLATREQHIRRERATSNICTNQELIALMATVFMTVYGKRGLRELAEQNLAKAHYLGTKLPRRFTGPYFNEFVAVSSDPEGVNRSLEARRIIGGLPLRRHYPELEHAMLLCCTETAKRPDMDALAAAMNAWDGASTGSALGQITDD
jgi:glycine dehydrogenase subunit 1